MRLEMSLHRLDCRLQLFLLQWLCSRSSHLAGSHGTRLTSGRLEASIQMLLRKKRSFEKPHNGSFIASSSGSSLAHAKSSASFHKADLILCGRPALSTGLPKAFPREGQAWAGHLLGEYKVGPCLSQMIYDRLGFLQPWSSHCLSKLPC